LGETRVGVERRRGELLTRPDRLQRRFQFYRER
jgi:hypothetical protein